MRSKNFIDAVRQSAAVNRDWQPHDGVTDLRTSRTWPLCLTCGREVDHVEVKNVNNWGFELWASCSHRETKDPPAEDYMRIKFPFRIEGDVMADDRANIILGAAMRAFTPFPTSHE